MNYNRRALSIKLTTNLLEYVPQRTVPLKVTTFFKVNLLWMKRHPSRTKPAWECETCLLTKKKHK